MTMRSIRARLTAWYVGVLALALAGLAAGSWWLARRSIADATDAALRSRIESVGRFIRNMERELPAAERQEEFREYAALGPNELLEVVDGDGLVLARPAQPDWAALREAARDADGPGPGPGPEDGAIRLTDATAGRGHFRVAHAALRTPAGRYEIVAAASTDASADALARFARLLGLLVPLLLALAAIGGWAISRRALAPVDRMTAEVRTITLDRLDRRLAVPAADDELRRLAVTFNAMLARLEDAVAEMTRLTAEASHELRTPVTLIRATADVTLARDRTPAEYRQALADVLEQGERMTALVDDLLALARADAGLEPADPGPTDLAGVAAETTAGILAAARRRSQHIALDLPGSPVAVGVGTESTRRLLLILLDNALKYSPEGSTVRVRVRLEDGDTRARIDVVDDGIGIAPGDRDRVFDRFFRGREARQAADGSGLGLAIARTIVARVHGTIEIQAAPAGRGCQVTVTLPADGAGAPADRPPAGVLA
ncbi:MAG: ATP-binding protein [Vicinamibacterales bacterium]